MLSHKINVIPSTIDHVCTGIRVIESKVCHRDMNDEPIIKVEEKCLQEENLLQTGEI